MGYTQRSKSDQLQGSIVEAIQGLENKEFPSIRSAARHFEVPFTTLRDRIAGTKTRAESYEMRQILSNAEEKALVRWITRLTSTSYPIIPALLKETVEEIWKQRV